MDENTLTTQNIDHKFQFLGDIPFKNLCFQKNEFL
jgi:hypothetical protein